MSATPPILLEPFARPLLLAHAIIGFTAVFSSTHLAAYAWLGARGRDVSTQLRRFGWIAPLALCAQLLLGFLLYPNYRVHVRAEQLEREGLQWLANLFDFKEHAAALALPLLLGAGLVGRSLSRAAQLSPLLRAQLSRALLALALSAAALVWSAALIGLYVTARHPVGAP